jgi:hypothetical protein
MKGLTKKFVISWWWVCRGMKWEAVEGCRECVSEFRFAEK